MNETDANTEIKTPGQIAYEAYLDFVGGESIYGHPLAEWLMQGEQQQAAWEAAAQAVLFAPRLKTVP